MEKEVEDSILIPIISVYSPITTSTEYGFFYIGDYLQDIFKSYHYNDANIHRQLILDVPRSNVYVNFTKIQTATTFLESMNFSLPRLLCTQASLFFPYMLITKLYSSFIVTGGGDEKENNNAFFFEQLKDEIIEITITRTFKLYDPDNMTTNTVDIKLLFSVCTLKNTKKAITFMRKKIGTIEWTHLI